MLLRRARRRDAAGDRRAAGQFDRGQHPPLRHPERRSRGRACQPGEPVRGPDGLIGRTLDVSPNTARVILLVDPESIVPVRRTRDGLPAIAVGRGDGWLEVKSAAGSAATFTRGDVFVTSGNGGLFPPGIPVVARGQGFDATPRSAARSRSPKSSTMRSVMKVFIEQPPVGRTANREGRHPRPVRRSAAPAVGSALLAPLSVMVGSLDQHLPVHRHLPGAAAVRTDDAARRGGCGGRTRCRSGRRCCSGCSTTWSAASRSAARWCCGACASSRST